MKKLKCTLCSEEVDTKSTSLIEHYAKHNITVQNNSAFKDFLATFISSNCCSKEEVYIVCFVCGKIRVQKTFVRNTPIFRVFKRGIRR